MNKLWHRFLAFSKREFWAHCPKCHCHFGGHQGYEEHIKIKDKTYRYICHKCVKELKNVKI